jgi:hypoxanthine-DNA glycosylase
MTTPLLRGLPPVIDARARVLILGSFPSVRSLADGQYYANPRNAFWPIVGDVFGFDCAADYARRLTALQSHGVALWDVLGGCRRVGSADSAIDSKSLVVNDFAALFAEHPNIPRVYFNGAKAADLYERFATAVIASAAKPSAAKPGAADHRHQATAVIASAAKPGAAKPGAAVNYQRLPSTSPANAIPRAAKLAAWTVIRETPRS